MKQDDELIATLALRLGEDVGPVTFKKLMEIFSRPSKALGASKRQWQSAARLTRMDYRRDIASGRLEREAENEIMLANAAGVEILGYFDERYPQALREIYDPPIVLFVKGQLSSLQIKKSVAVVGSRTPSLYGCKMAKLISRDLANAGVAVVSGLALGIDAAAHEGALKAEGVTVAVLGSGHFRIYPAENRRLADQIYERGALISEYPTETVAQPGYFPVRNRIISGLSCAVLVVEANEKSGALITADAALEQNRDVFALPGNADSLRSVGTNQLIKQGAKLVLSAADILEELKIEVPVAEAGDLGSGRKVCVEALSVNERHILELVGDEPVAVDELIKQSGMRSNQAIALLSCLEIKGAVRQLPGKNYVRKQEP